MGNKLPLLYEYVPLFLGLPESATCLVHIYQDVITFHQLAYRLFSLRANCKIDHMVAVSWQGLNSALVFQKIYKPTWKALNDTFNHLVGSLESHGEFVQVAWACFQNPQAALDLDAELVPAESWSDKSQNWEDIKAKLLDYLRNMKEYRDNFEDEEKNRKEKAKKSVLAWILASKKTHSLHKKFQDTRICSDTGRWLFKRYSEVSEWMKEDQPPESAIWLHGSRGFGNNIL